MYDIHYDLLTILYFRMKNGNKHKDINKLIKDLKMIYRKDNITGGIVNLYFMSKEEMKDELDINEEELDVSKMLEISLNNLKILKQEGVIPYDTDFLYSIEGCDYIKDTLELEKLYEMGTRSILPVWNEKNKYGSGNRSNEGLTDLGKKFISKAIDLGMIIDVSHANEKTFFDIMDLVEKEKSLGKETFVIASHSNVRALCDIKRNLTDKQLIRLKEVGGYIGLLVHTNFLKKDHLNSPFEIKKKLFIEHLNYVKDKIGFDDDKILISTDNMNFNPDPDYHNLEAIHIESANKDLRELLGYCYEEEFIDRVMTGNAKHLFNKVRYYEELYDRRLR